MLASEKIDSGPAMQEPSSHPTVIDHENNGEYSMACFIGSLFVILKQLIVFLGGKFIRQCIVFMLVGSGWSCF